MKDQKVINNKGYYTVEAAIVVPVVFIAILSISALGRFYGVYEKVAFVGADSARVAMINSYLYGSDIFLYERTSKHLKEDKFLEDAYVSSYKSGYSKGRLNNVISFDINYDVDIKAPLLIFDNPRKKESFTCRKFIGNVVEGSPFTFDRMEIDESEKMVYLFPLDGKKYHSNNCTYVVPAYFERILTRELKKEYLPCGQCDSSKINFGDTVYVFLSYGDYYHSKECKTVRKNIVKASLSTALEKGYKACNKCGGGQ